jgi:hypothetical protein
MATSLKYFALKRGIAKLREHSTTNASPEFLLSLIRPLLTNVGLYGFELGNEKLYRARWNNKPRLFDHVDELKYPPPSSVTEKGRLNNVGESVLYAAVSELATIVELRPELNRIFTISPIDLILHTMVQYHHL